MDYSGPPTSAASTQPEGVVLQREDILPGSRVTRRFVYGQIEVTVTEHGEVTIVGAVGVPAEEFATFMEMLVAFHKRAVASAPSKEVETGSISIPDRPEGACQSCGSTKQLAEGDMRKCAGCGDIWRVT